jgi:hypothetical protein
MLVGGMHDASQAVGMQVNAYFDDEDAPSVSLSCQVLVFGVAPSRAGINLNPLPHPWLRFRVLSFVVTLQREPKKRACLFSTTECGATL